MVLTIDRTESTKECGKDNNMKNITSVNNTEVRDHSTDKDLNRCDYLVSMIMTPKERENHPFGWFETVSEYMIERG